MKTFILSLLVSVSSWATPSPLAKGSYKIDLMHSKVGFEVTHLVISTVEGSFKTFSGSIIVDKDITKSQVNAEVDINSIDTNVADRDNHLKSADFFDVEKFPKMNFKSTEIKGNEKSFKMTGDLTIKGITKKVTFDSTYKGSAKDAYGNTKVAFEAKTVISRKEFGLTWNKMVEAGPVVGDEITLVLKIQAAKDK